MRLNNYKGAHKSFKTKKRETQKLFHGHYIQDDHEGKDDWQFTLIGQCTTNTKERFIGNIVLKRSFQMALMSVKNLVYNKLARQNIFCFFLIQFRFTVIIFLIYIIIIIIIITIIFIISIIIIFTLLLSESSLLMFLILSMLFILFIFFFLLLTVYITMICVCVLFVT